MPFKSMINGFQKIYKKFVKKDSLASNGINIIRTNSNKFLTICVDDVQKNIYNPKDLYTCINQTVSKNKNINNIYIYSNNAIHPNLTSHVLKFLEESINWDNIKEVNLDNVHLNAKSVEIADNIYDKNVYIRSEHSTFEDIKGDYRTLFRYQPTDISIDKLNDVFLESVEFNSKNKVVNILLDAENESIDNLLDVEKKSKECGAKVNFVVNRDTKISKDNLSILKDLETKLLESKICVNYNNKSCYAPLDEFEEMVDSLNTMVSLIESKGLSPLEKLMYAYDMVKANPYVKEAVKNHSGDSRYLHKVLTGDKIVCAGYSRILEELANRLNIPCSYITGNSVKNNSIIGRHARNLVYLKDDKYNIDGFFELDATWDSYSKESKNKIAYYNHFLMPINSRNRKEYLNYKKSSLLNGINDTFNSTSGNISLAILNKQDLSLGEFFNEQLSQGVEQKNLTYKNFIKAIKTVRTVQSIDGEKTEKNIEKEVRQLSIINSNREKVYANGTELFNSPDSTETKLEEFGLSYYVEDTLYKAKQHLITEAELMKYSFNKIYVDPTKSLIESAKILVDNVDYLFEYEYEDILTPNETDINNIAADTKDLEIE